MPYHQSVVFLVHMYRLRGACYQVSVFVQPQLIVPDDSLEWFYPLHTQQPCLGLPFAAIQVVPTTLALVVVETLPLKCFEIPVYAFDLHFSGCW